MPTQKADVGHDFASVLNSAAKTPDDFEGLGKDLPDGFPFPAGNSRIIDSDDEGIPGIAAFDFKIHRRVFTIFHPWENCARCGQDIASNTVSLPAAGDYECPHTAREEYEEITNEILAGKLIFGSEQEVVQKDGTIVISLRWYERIPSKKKKRPAGVDGTSPEPDA